MYGYVHLLSSVDNEIDNQTYVLELMVKARENAQKIIHKTIDTHKFINSDKSNNNVKDIVKNKEKFVSPINENLLLDSDAQNYLITLNNLDSWIQNEYNGPNGIKDYIKGLVKTAANNRIENKQLILDTLTNIYVISYLDSINHQNAEAYKVYLKYKDPKTNKFYAQYLK